MYLIPDVLCTKIDSMIYKNIKLNNYFCALP